MQLYSLGLLEVMVVHVNAGGDAPPDPPSVGDVTGPFQLQDMLLRQSRATLLIL